MQILLQANFFLALNQVTTTRILFIMLHAIIADFIFIHVTMIIILHDYFIN